jgi:2-polyprenyl-3-methyl-5-hydroxy-6-metoxy-1,4-benzoquinol methylase
MELTLSKEQISSCYSDLANSGKFPDGTYLHKTFLQMIDSEINLSEKLDVLDVGGGAGYFGLHFASLEHKVTISDITFEALKVAKYRSNEINNIKITVGDVENLPFSDNTFDLVSCIFVFSHLNNPDRAMGELGRVLKNKGQLIVSFENRYWHAIAQGLAEKYESANSLLVAEVPIIKAYGILPPVRLYIISEIENICYENNLKINSIKGTRFITAFQEYIKNIGTTDTERLMINDDNAMKFEDLMSNNRDLLPLARHFLVFCEKI